MVRLNKVTMKRNLIMKNVRTCAAIPEWCLSTLVPIEAVDRYAGASFSHLPSPKPFTSSLRESDNLTDVIQPSIA